MQKRFNKLLSIVLTLTSACSVCSLAACGNASDESRVYKEILINDFERSSEYDAIQMGN